MAMLLDRSGGAKEEDGSAVLQAETARMRFSRSPCPSRTRLRHVEAFLRGLTADLGAVLLCESGMSARLPCEVSRRRVEFLPGVQPMPIAVQCPECGSNFRAPDSTAGKTLPCPKCKKPLTVVDKPPSEGWWSVPEKDERLEETLRQAKKDKRKRRWLNSVWSLALVWTWVWAGVGVVQLYRERYTATVPEPPSVIGLPLLAIAVGYVTARAITEMDRLL